MNRMLAVVIGLAMSATTSAVLSAPQDPSQQAQILIAQHPAWSKWLSDPELQKETLTGEQMPNSPWRVHDIRAPQPPVVDTGSVTCSGAAPSDADVLFDGHGLGKWTGDRLAEWSDRGESFQSGGHVYNFLKTKESFGDLQVHVEWKAPVDTNPPLDPQHRGNSGVFLMGLYEIQILDSYDNETYPDGAAGAVFGTAAPLANPTRPPGEWNCYDIVFRAPRFSGGRLETPGWVSVLFNGVLAQAHTMLMGPTATANGAVAHYTPHASELPLELQDHGNPESRDSFRNVWVRRLKLD